MSRALREKDIVHETGAVWVHRAESAYVVYVSGVTHSISDSAYELNDDGLSLAKARAEYIAARRSSP